MEDLANMLQIASIMIAGLVYTCIWGKAIDNISYYRYNAKTRYKVWLVIHIIVIIIAVIWAWTY